jgi:2-haloacid dehalogenase
MIKDIRACVFDAYGTLLDVNSAVARNAALNAALTAVLAKTKTKTKTEARASLSAPLSQLWRQKQLEYTWTRTLMNRYADFWQVTEEALDFALKTYSLDGDAELKNSLLQSYLSLTAYPDAAQALAQIATLDLTTAILSNGTPHMLQEALRANQLEELIDPCLSVDEIRIYKPDPRVYQLASDRLGLSPRQICFVSSNPWDVAGAASFGFKAVRINRQNSPPEYAFAATHAHVSTLAELPALLRTA